MEYLVNITDNAYAMLEKNSLFLANVSPTAADKLVDEILDDIDTLKNNPSRFPILEINIFTDCVYHRLLSCNRYLVLYEIWGDIVNVDYIVDCRSDYRWLI
ncbi:MAG: type II toxin-antitoxin system RelE/ParE family toxin [Oscillospiraceae bacterium]|jgi:hypothetical protein|nr:type II toxin-antitoxin system RelE/ParE family toxin [Oscillospiraceae bacterium]